MENQKMTPLMQQYWGVKGEHPDKIVLFRMGDFYEMFHDDAVTAAPILNIALTCRNKKAADETKMCGVPHHSIAGPIARLLKAGHRVAICDQIEDPAVAKGIVKRAVTRVLTPGMVYDPETLDQVSANYLASFDTSMVAFADVTTGEAFYYRVNSASERDDVLALLRPVELVLSEKDSNPPAGILVSMFEGEMDARDRLKRYIGKLQGEELVRSLRPFEERSLVQSLRLSQTTIQHLEIFETSRGDRQPTLFSAVDRTRTAAGARRLKNWLAFPLVDASKITARQDQVEFWQKDVEKTRAVRHLLGDLGDLERRMGKILSSTGSARDLVQLAQSIGTGFEIGRHLPQPPAGFDELNLLAGKLARALNLEPPLAVKDGGMIRRGFRPDLDQLIELSENAQTLLLEFEAREKEATKINSLKVRYNNVFGFYIELTKVHSEKAPAHYMRKQTLTNAERFTTKELNQLEEKILSAKSRRADLEYGIYTELRNEAIGFSEKILAFASLLAEADVFTGLAWLALDRDYRRPKMGTAGIKLHLCRHPVVEQVEKKKFVPNTIEMEPGAALLLTGPNMAGKSTLMRQTALIAVLAQAGSFVPAESAELPVFTKVLSRIGASDSLSEGLSTFMVEMRETAEIIAQADSRSLIIMDEIGRGTSTYDGLSLAQAIFEHLAGDKKPYLLFATHYQELTSLPELWPQIRNVHMGIQERRGEIEFLYTLKPGPANRSYGIHVAKLAKLPAAVTNRAEALLHAFEEFQAAPSGGELQLSLTPMPSNAANADHDEILESLRAAGISTMTPLEALNKIAEWQQKLT